MECQHENYCSYLIEAYQKKTYLSGHFRHMGQTPSASSPKEIATRNGKNIETPHYWGYDLPMLEQNPGQVTIFSRGLKPHAVACTVGIPQNRTIAI
jgi:hypothetical protein